jgi:exo-beta-1,3-glucanase (GH17 family)
VPKPFAFTLPALVLISLGTIAAVWVWLAAPVTLVVAPVGNGTKLHCVSYAPFRGQQTPRDPDLIVSEAQIAEDLAELAKISQCVRTYSVDNGLDKVPALAAKAGLKVLLGVWIGRDHAKNRLLVDQAVSLAKNHPGTVTAIVVGNEVLLRGDLIVSDLRDIIRSVKTRVNIPVTYADVWEFWLRYREVADEVDFVTVHMLPYWEDFPPRAEDAAAHVDAIRQQMVTAFAGKEILIGETGWPSKGRMRDGALPSPINQARFLSEILQRARQENFRVTLFEAYDEPWKREWEGSVGGYWGLFDGSNRRLKYPPGAAVSNYPFWKLQLGCGLALSILVFAVSFLTMRYRLLPVQPVPWIAVTISATTGGILLGLAVDKMAYDSFGFGSWLLNGLLLGVGVATPLLSSSALISGRALPSFLELIGPSERRPRSLATMALGFTLILTTLMAAVTALSLVFDARWRDFPFASLTMAAAPLWILTVLSPLKSGRRPIAEALFAGLLAAVAVYVIFNEGFHNWQALWTAAAYGLLGATLWQARVAGVAGPVPAAAGGLSKDDPLGKQARVVQTDRRSKAGADAVAG